MGKKQQKDVKKVLPKVPAKTRELLTENAKKIIQKTMGDTSFHTTDQLWNEFLELNSLVKESRELEKDIAFPKHNRSENFESFLDWLKKNGAEVDGVEIGFYADSGYGLKCTKSLKAKQAVMHIPKSVVMSEDTAKKSSLKILAENDPLVSKMGNVCLALHLLNEFCDPNSFWHPYHKILPSTFSTVLYFTIDELKMLRGSPVFEEALKHRRNIARQYGYFYNMCQNHAKARKWSFSPYFTYDAYRWAVSCTMTRINRLPSNTAEVVYALIPAWDMCNHEYGSFSTGFDDKRMLLSCYAHRDFSAGEQFCIYYGPRSNSDFFLHNGFVYKDNPGDVFKIKMGVSKNDSNFDLKSDFLLDCDLPYSGTFTLTRSEEPISQKLLSVVSVICLQDRNEIEKLTKEKLMEPADRNTWTFLLTRLMLLLKSYRPTPQDVVWSSPEGTIHRLFKEEQKLLAHSITYLQSKLA